MQTVILQDLTIGYAAKGNQKVVAKGLNAAISSGELTCLLGRNGIGKSTLLRTLSAFQPPLGGNILIATPQGGGEVGGSVTLAATGGTANADQLSRLIGVVLTEKPDVRNMTAEDLVGMGRSPYTGFWGTLDDEDRQIVDESMALVGITPLKARMVHTLSDGERQKVMIAKALAQQTPVIYLDEPTAFLDFPSKVETLQLLRRLAATQGKTILLSTHDVELSLQLADRLWLLDTSSRDSAEAILYVGTPQELAKQGRLGRFIERDGIAFDPATLQIRITK